MTTTVHHGDCLDVLRAMPDASVDAIVTDPPYGLGFMGKAWDALPPGEEWARECLRVLKPGGHLLAFGGTRTSHRLACAVEDAGFEIRDSIAWLYGSGFPKSLDVSKAIDKMDAGTERRARNLRFTEWMRSTGVTSRQLDAVTSSFMGGHYLTVREQAAVPTADMFDLIRPLILEAVPEWVEALVRERTVESENYKARPITQAEVRPLVSGDHIGFDQRASTERERRDIPATDDARTWQGWGTALKPAHEPIVVARKPFTGTVAANVLAYGTGALNVDGCRVDGQPRTTHADGNHRTRPHTDIYGKGFGVHGAEPAPAGRWPVNVVLDESQAAALDEQSGILTSGGGRHWQQSEHDHIGPIGLRRTGEKAPGLAGDSGGASRFFYVARKENPCTEEKLSESAPPATTSPRSGPSAPCAAGSATTIDQIDARFMYVAKAPKKERPNVDGTSHPTVKPLTLMRWLVRLVTPPGGIVLDPFAGSGTTIEAAILEGFHVIGIEREADYLPLIQARIDRNPDTLFDGGVA